MKEMRIYNDVTTVKFGLIDKSLHNLYYIVPVVFSFYAFCGVNSMKRVIRLNSNTNSATDFTMSLPWFSPLHVSKKYKRITTLIASDHEHT